MNTHLFGGALHERAELAEELGVLDHVRAHHHVNHQLADDL